MTSFSIEADRDQVDAALALFEFVGGNSDDVLRVAINRTSKKVKTLASRKIREQVRLKASFVNGRLDITRATRQRLSGRIATPSRGLLMTRYVTDAQVSNAGDRVSFIKPPPVPARGIRVKVKPKGATKPLGKDRFYMILKNSRALGVAERRPRGQTGPQGGKFKVLYAPSLSQVFDSVRDEILPEAGDIYTAEQLDAMRFLLAKKFPRE